MLGVLREQVLRPEVLAAVYERTAKKIKEQFAHVPEELRLKRLELNRAETRVHNFMSSSPAAGQREHSRDALAEAEKQLKTLKIDVEAWRMRQLKRLHRRLVLGLPIA